MEDTRSPFEIRKENAWTQVYDEYWVKFGLWDEWGQVRAPGPRETGFRQAVRQTTSLFTECDNDMDLADALFQMRETLELKLKTITGGK
jgi:hypothetical protein